MFAAMCENPDFFKPRLKQFIAVAPVLRVTNLGSQMLRNLALDKKALKALESLGPEVCTKASGGDFLADMIVSSYVGGSISDQIVGCLSDEDPSTIDPLGKANHFKFYPSGCSFRQIDHFKQLLVTGEFKKYDHGCPDKNKEAYGSPVPPFYDLANLNGLNIMLVCGTTDLLASPPDYRWLRDELSARNNLTF